MSNWTCNALDRRIASELQESLPPRVFDAHAHLWRRADLSEPLAGIWENGPDEARVADWRHHVECHIGMGRLCGGLLFPVPSLPHSRISQANDYLFAQIAGDASLKGLALVAPPTSADRYRPLLDNPQFAGFKPYHLFAEQKPTFQASLSSFLPEWAWAMADAHGLAIMLHLVRDAALADRDNLRELRHFCTKYRDARLILAHAARGFHAPHTVRGISGLRGLDNVWFDTSAICEPAAIQAILHEFGPRRLLWGSDFPVSEIRGRCVTVGDGFAWLQHDTVHWQSLSPAVVPLLVGLESLRALHEAADALGLDATDLQDIFADNARRLLGLQDESGTQTEDLYRHAKGRIPGGTQLLSKRPEMLAPGQWPAYFRKARGCEIWDLDDRHYIDMSTNGIGACLLGFCDDDVTRAVQRRIYQGSMCTLNSPEEIELADLLCEIHPWAEQVRFARCGGEACALAVRIARATTDRPIVAICGYHGWHDWYLAANLGESDALRGHLLPGLEPAGVPRELRGTAIPFGFNDRNALQALFEDHGARLAAVIMEPCRSEDPDVEFLELVRDGTRAVGALLITDEITVGWRLGYGGAHLKFGLRPDLAIFAKALGNGHPMAAVIGTSAAMEGAHRSFVSSTYWTESVGPTAALATLRKMRVVDVPRHIARIGSSVQERWAESGRRHGLSVAVGGYPCLAHFRFEHDQAESLRTLFVQMMLARGFLAGTSFYPTMAHSAATVEQYGEAVDAVFRRLAEILATGGDVTSHLRGPVAHQGFQRLAN